jgi:hypothetical protein
MRLRWFVVGTLAVLAACTSEGAEEPETATTATSAERSSATTAESGAVGLDGRPLSPALDRWAARFDEISGRPVEIGSEPPDVHRRSCREHLRELDRDALDDAPDARLDELQAQFMPALESYYEACAGTASAEERAQLLQRVTGLGTEIHRRLTELGVPAR